MQCTHCGVQLPNDSVFCIACHSMLNEGGQSSGTPTLRLGDVPKNTGKAARKPLFSAKTMYLLIGAFVLVAGVTAVIVYHYVK